MTLKISLIFLAVLSFSCAHRSQRQPNSETSVLPFKEFLEMVEHPVLKVKMRAGYTMEQRDLKACVIYLQGLADSVRNHKPYFSELSSAGYRVIYFDYMGQGGSEGAMNRTRIQVDLPPGATREMQQRYQRKDKHQEIPEQADFFWERYKHVQNERGQSCSDSPKLLIGWSTGGLSAYRMAHENRADAVVLIAPGIHPKTMVGESAEDWSKMIFLRQTITERTLTRNKFKDQENPHLDPVRPKSPAHSPQFAMNLKGIAGRSTAWKINPAVRGYVFLSGDEDTYVKREATEKTLRQNAPHFRMKSYPGALHELDNEIPEVAQDLYRETILFLDEVMRELPPSSI